MAIVIYSHLVLRLVGSTLRFQHSLLEFRELEKKENKDQLTFSFFQSKIVVNFLFNLNFNVTRTIFLIFQISPISNRLETKYTHLFRYKCWILGLKRAR